MRSLASLKSDGEVQVSEALTRGESLYLQPYLAGQSKNGQQVYLKDTFKEPDCLRFCPSNSSDQVEISLSGFTVHSKSQG
jgi:hypothetical protein